MYFDSGLGRNTWCEQFNELNCQVFSESFVNKSSMTQRKLYFFFNKSASKRRIEEDNSGDTDRNISTEGESIDDNLVVEDQNAALN